MATEEYENALCEITKLGLTRTQLYDCLLEESYEECVKRAASFEMWNRQEKEFASDN